jgi:hypothetical protein
MRLLLLQYSAQGGPLPALHIGAWRGMIAQARFFIVPDHLQFSLKPKNRRQRGDTEHPPILKKSN